MPLAWEVLRALRSSVPAHLVRVAARDPLGVALIDALWSAPPPGTCASVATQVGVSGRTLYRRFGRFAPLLSRIGLLCVLLRSAETGRHSIRAAANSCGIATSTVRRRTATILSCTPSEVTPAVCLELLAGTALSVARLVGSD